MAYNAQTLSIRNKNNSCDLLQSVEPDRVCQQSSTTTEHIPKTTGKLAFHQHYKDVNLIAKHLKKPTWAIICKNINAVTIALVHTNFF